MLPPVARFVALLHQRTCGRQQKYAGVYRASPLIYCITYIHVTEYINDHDQDLRSNEFRADPERIPTSTDLGRKLQAADIGIFGATAAFQADRKPVTAGADLVFGVPQTGFIQRLQRLRKAP